jgi:hypothetical protein
MAAVVEELRKLIPTLTKLDTVKEPAIELSVDSLPSIQFVRYSPKYQRL